MQWIRRTIRKLIDMWPRARRYGLRYYWDYEFRKKMRNRETNIRNKQKYGTVFLSNRKRIKNNLVNRYSKRCRFCQKRFKRKNLTIDHIIPVSQGGTNDYRNLQLLCRPCHNYKDRQKQQNTYPIIKVALEQANAKTIH